MALARPNRSVTLRVYYPEGSVERRAVAPRETDWGERMAAEGKAERQMTYAELCQAIEEGRLSYTIRDGHYEVRAADVRRPRLALPDLTDIPAQLLGLPELGQPDFSV